MIGEMTCEHSVATTEENAREIALAAISVERDDGVDVLEERRQWLRMRRIDLVGGHMPLEVSGLMNPVVGGVGSFCDPPPDDVGEFLQSTSVIRHDAEWAA